PLARAVRGGVVDDDDPVDELRDPAERRADQRLLVVRGHDDPDSLPFEHAESLSQSPLRGASRGTTVSHRSAARAPRIRPISAAMTTVLRRLRAVILFAVAPVMI